MDRLDKLLSRPIFHLSLPLPAELLLTVPATWFGCPLYAAGIVPLMAASLPEQHNKSTRLASIFAGASGLAIWLKLCHDSVTEGKGITKAYSFFSKKWLLAVPNITMASLALASSTSESVSISALYLSSWFCTQLLIEAMKGIFWRLRPTAVMSEELVGVHRTFQEVTTIVGHASQANLSFPSGDAAGGSIFATAVFFSNADPGVRSVALVAAALCGVGRVFFHCHHILDVVVGQLVGVGVTTFLHFQVPEVRWIHVLMAQLFLMLMWKPVQMLKPNGGVHQALNADFLTKKL